MAYQVTVTLRRARTLYQRQEVTATFSEAQAREYHGYSENEEMNEGDLAEYALEAAQLVETASGWLSDGFSYDEPLDPPDDMEITETEGEP